MDGHFNRETDKWIDDKKPIPYTKDFGELISGYQKNSGLNITRIYGGLSYATLIRPSILKRWNFSLGGETAFSGLTGKIFGKETNLFSAYHFILNGAEKYLGNSTFMTGIKFGGWEGKGVLLFAEYYSGSRRFSEYYNQRVNEFGLGFNVDF